jgi:hypothetical protein
VLISYRLMFISIVLLLFIPDKTNYSFVLVYSKCYCYYVNLLLLFITDQREELARLEQACGDY